MEDSNEKTQVAPRKKGIRPTKAEYRARVHGALDLLQAGHVDTEIKRILSERYNIHRNSVPRYLRRARDILLKQLGRPEEEHKAEAYYIYRGVLINEKSTTTERLKAQERIDKLLGLEGPIRYELLGEEQSIEDFNVCPASAETLAGALMVLKDLGIVAPGPALLEMIDESKIIDQASDNGDEAWDSSLKGKK